ncbi:MAG TPA: DUF2442 domain-containing protein [Longimicrobium sp.]|jgi:hypothetical protein
MEKHGKRELSDAEILAQLDLAREAERAAERTEPRARAAHYDAATERVVVELRNGAAFAFPAALVPRLAEAAPEQRAAVEVYPGGDALRWDALDEDVSLAGVLAEVLGPAFVYREFARAGGRSRSEAKAAAARANGRKGGRPRKAPPVTGGASYSHRAAQRHVGVVRETPLEPYNARPEEPEEKGRAPDGGEG